MRKNPKKTQECFNNIRIRFPTLENESYARRTRILHTMYVCMYACVYLHLNHKEAWRGSRAIDGTRHSIEGVCDLYKKNVPSTNLIFVRPTQRQSPNQSLNSNQVHDHLRGKQVTSDKLKEY